MQSSGSVTACRSAPLPRPLVQGLVNSLIFVGNMVLVPSSLSGCPVDPSSTQFRHHGNDMAVGCGSDALSCPVVIPSVFRQTGWLYQLTGQFANNSLSIKSQTGQLAYSKFLRITGLLHYIYTLNLILTPTPLNIDSGKDYRVGTVRCTSSAE